MCWAPACVFVLDIQHLFALWLNNDVIVMSPCTSAGQEQSTSQAIKFIFMLRWVELTNTVLYFCCQSKSPGVTLAGEHHVTNWLLLVDVRFWALTRFSAKTQQDYHLILGLPIHPASGLWVSVFRTDSSRTAAFPPASQIQFSLCPTWCLLSAPTPVGFIKLPPSVCVDMLSSSSCWPITSSVCWH